MALAPGTTIGHYEVTALLGEGGMGQAWEATDTKLQRQVALKVLPDAFAGDPERLSRTLPTRGGDSSLPQSSSHRAVLIGEVSQKRTGIAQLCPGQAPDELCVQIALLSRWLGWVAPISWRAGPRRAQK